MRNFSRVLLFSLVILSIKTFAYTAKEGNVSAVLGPFLSRTNFNGNATQPRSPWMGGLGLVALGDISPHGTLEIGLFYMNKVFYRDEGLDTLTEQTQLVNVTMGYRYWLGSYLSIGAGFYTSYPIGDPVLIDRQSGTGKELDTSATDPSNHGVFLSAAYDIWSDDRVSVITDLRYAVSLTNKVNEKADHYGVLIGFKYFIQEKQVRAPPTEDELSEP